MSFGKGTPSTTTSPGCAGFVYCFDAVRRPAGASLWPREMMTGRWCFLGFGREPPLSCGASPTSSSGSVRDVVVAPERFGGGDAMSLG